MFQKQLFPLRVNGENPVSIAASFTSNIGDQRLVLLLDKIG